METPTEAYVVALYDKGGKRSAKRFPLKVPLEIATERYEDCSDLQITEMVRDLNAEQSIRAERAQRRAEIQERTGGWDPFSALRAA